MPSNQTGRLVAEKALRVLKIADLKIDPSYQRNVKPRHKRIVAGFNPEALGVPLVGERDDGSLWIVDGLQRITAMGKLGKKTVRAEVFHSRGPEHEAEVFNLVNLNRTRPMAAESFAALLTAHDPLAWKIKEIVESEGFALNLNSTGVPSGMIPKGLQNGRARMEGRAISCVNTLVRILKGSKDVGDSPTVMRKSVGLGEAAVRFALRTIKQAWPDDTQATREVVVGGLASFFLRRNGTVDDTRMVRTMRTTNPAKLLYTSGLGVGSRVSNFVDALEKVYRKVVRRTPEEVRADEAKAAEGE